MAREYKPFVHLINRPGCVYYYREFVFFRGEGGRESLHLFMRGNTTTLVDVVKIKTETMYFHGNE